LATGLRGYCIGWLSFRRFQKTDLIMFHFAPSRHDLPKPLPVEPDPCALLVFHKSRYLASLRRRVGSADVAEDVFQDFAVKVIRAARAREPVGNTAAWVFRVLRNTLFDHYRRKDARLRGEAGYSVYSQLLSEASDPDPTAAASDADAAQSLEAALASIRPDQAGVIRALYLQDLPRDVVARELNLEIGTLNVRAFRARRALQDALKRQDGGSRDGDAAIVGASGGDLRRQVSAARSGDAARLCEA
jgi:RNA polymerase sigma factor (sigma-70 family)